MTYSTLPLCQHPINTLVISQLIEALPPNPILSAIVPAYTQTLAYNSLSPAELMANADPDTGELPAQEAITIVAASGLTNVFQAREHYTSLVASQAAAQMARSGMEPAAIAFSHVEPDGFVTIGVVGRGHCSKHGSFGEYIRLSIPIEGWFNDTPNPAEAFVSEHCMYDPKTGRVESRYAGKPNTYTTEWDKHPMFTHDHIFNSLAPLTGEYKGRQLLPPFSAIEIEVLEKVEDGDYEELSMRNDVILFDLHRGDEVIKYIALGCYTAYHHLGLLVEKLSTTLKTEIMLEDYDFFDISYGVQGITVTLAAPPEMPAKKDWQPMAELWG